MALVLNTTGVLAADYYVQQSVGNDSNPGTGWGAGQALLTIQKAVDLARVNVGADTIHVAEGNYSEHVVIENAEQMALLGGYPATGGTVRAPRTNVTTINGANTGVPVSIQEAINIVLDGFSIQHGVNSGPGGGIVVDEAETVVISNNVISNNSTVTAGAWGGGIGVLNSIGVDILKNTIEWNLSDVGSAGGGISYWSNCTGTIKGNIIRHNTATDSGGGISIEYGSVVTISNNSIYENSAGNYGGGIKIITADGVLVDHNLIQGNTAGLAGGGIIYWSSLRGRFLANRILSNIANYWGGGMCILENAQTDAVVNNVIAGNQSSDHGGGISLDNGASATLINNTIVKNSSTTGGGGLYTSEGTTATVTNCILKGNKQDQINAYENSVNVFFSDVMPAWVGPGSDNFSADPKFVLADDYHLAVGSPCINTGTSTGAPADDLESNARPYGSGVDMGAYEWTPGPDLVGVWKKLVLSKNLKKVTVSLMVKNLKGVKAGPFKVFFYLSRNGKKLPSAPFKKVTLKAGLRGGASRLVNFAYTFSGSVSKKYLVAVVDPDRQVREIRENNNVSSKLIRSLK